MHHQAFLITNSSDQLSTTIYVDFGTMTLSWEQQLPPRQVVRVEPIASREQALALIQRSDDSSFKIAVDLVKLEAVYTTVPVAYRALAFASFDELNQFFRMWLTELFEETSHYDFNNRRDHVPDLSKPYRQFCDQDQPGTKRASKPRGRAKAARAKR